MSTKKTAQPFKQPIELYTAMLDQTIRANRIVAKGIERTMEEQLGLFEAAIDSTRPLAAAKQPEEILAVQMDAWKAFGEKLVATTGKLAEIQRETGTELKDIAVDSFKASTRRCRRPPDRVGSQVPRTEPPHRRFRAACPDPARRRSSQVRPVRCRIGRS